MLIMRSQAAARLLKIRNLVWASSETLLGYPFESPPAYVPLDDDVPATPQVVYAMAKDLEEQMACHYCHWDPQLKMIGLRFLTSWTLRVRRLPIVRKRSGIAEVEPLVLHRRARRGRWWAFSRSLASQEPRTTTWQSRR